MANERNIDESDKENERNVYKSNIKNEIMDLDKSDIILRLIYIKK